MSQQAEPTTELEANQPDTIERNSQTEPDNIEICYKRLSDCWECMAENIRTCWQTLCDYAIDLCDWCRDGCCCCLPTPENHANKHTKGRSRLRKSPAKQINSLGNSPLNQNSHQYQQETQQASPSSLVVMSPVQTQTSPPNPLHPNMIQKNLNLGSVGSLSSQGKTNTSINSTNSPTASIVLPIDANKENKLQLFNSTASLGQQQQVRQYLDNYQNLPPPKIDFIETGSIFGDRRKTGIDPNMLLIENGRFRSPGHSRVIPGPNGRSIRVSFISGFPAIKSVDSTQSNSSAQSKQIQSDEDKNDTVKKLTSVTSKSSLVSRSHKSATKSNSSNEMKPA